MRRHSAQKELFLIASSRMTTDELMSGENKAHTRKIEQCYIFTLLMQLEKKIFPMSEMFKRNPSGRDSVMINEIAWSPWPIKLDFILL